MTQSYVCNCDDSVVHYLERQRQRRVCATNSNILFNKSLRISVSYIANISLATLKGLPIEIEECQTPASVKSAHHQFPLAVLFLNG